MKKNVIEFLKKSSMNMIEKKSSLTMFGETKIPAEMLKELEKKNSKK